ncbi:MAG TPA: MBL fold metallo-hydrolase [Nitrospiria bacterium]|jgi:glyoxylase-like metal-dependent hydrolase (beta-lactamase superfamily II)
MILEHLAVGLFQCNCLILGCETTHDAIVVDPGDEADRILEILGHRGLKLKAILHTHAHLDHVGATHQLQSITGASVALHGEDLFLHSNLKMQAEFLGLPVPTPARIDHFLKDKEEVKVGDLQTQILHTPGHTPGSICFHFPGEREILLTGDTLFAGSIGRTDLWGGSYDDILNSVRQLMEFKDETEVFPGHGPVTTIAQERNSNPFVQELF